MKIFKGYTLKAGEHFVFDGDDYAEVWTEDGLVRHFNHGKWYVMTEIMVTMVVKVEVEEGTPIDNTLRETHDMSAIDDAIEYGRYTIEVAGPLS